MPPKNKTKKAIAAELKEKNTAQAKEIVEKLKRGAAKSDLTGDATEKAKKPPSKKNENVTAESKKKSTIQPKETLVKLKPATQNAENTEAPMETDSDSIDGGSVLVHSEITEHVATNSNSRTKKSVEIVASSSKASKTLMSAANAKNGTPKGYAYQYAIDCKRVADSIDVIDLQRFIKAHLKVMGQKNNLDGTVAICCEGQKVVIKSKTFIPKKALRFLSKKFLKKNWNIRVVSKNTHSYEYKYVGTL